MPDQPVQLTPRSVCSSLSLSPFIRISHTEENDEDFLLNFFTGKETEAC